MNSKIVFLPSYGEIKFIAEMHAAVASVLIANIARTKRRRIKSFGTQVSSNLKNTLVDIQSSQGLRSSYTLVM